MIAICTGITTLTISCSRFETRDVLANVLAVEGEAIVIHRGKPERATASTLLEEGDQLRTAECSSATISLVPGARIGLGEDSELRVEKLQIHKLGTTVSHPVRARNAKVRLVHGILRASVVFRTVRPHIRLHVMTPTTTCEGAPGDIFSVSVTDATTDIVCAAGKVAVTTEVIKDPVTVEAGYAREFSKTRDSFALPSQASDKIEAQDALMAAESSQDLERAKINLIPGVPAF